MNKKQYSKEYREKIRNDPDKYKEYLEYFRKRNEKVKNDPELWEKECKRLKEKNERNKRRRQEDPEYREHTNEYSRNWRKQNLEKIKQDPVAYEGYRESKNKKHREWRAKKNEEGLGPWQIIKANPEKHKEENEKNRARIAKREEKWGMTTHERLKKNPEKYRRRQKLANERYEKSKAEDPEFMQKRREVWNQNKENWDCFPRCPTCNMKHMSRTYKECQPCRNVQEVIKKQEHEIHTLLNENKLFPSLCDAKGPCASADNRRRPDFVFSSPDLTHTIILEVDEDYHRSYTPECEMTRLGEVQDQFPEKPVYFIRYHPIRLKGKSPYTSITKQSKKELLYALKVVFALPQPKEGELPCGYDICFIGYPGDRVKELSSTRERMQHERMTELIKNRQIVEKRAKTAEIKRKQRAKKLQNTNVFGDI